MPDADQFSRDLGYLDRFFEKLESHTGNLPSDAGQRLRTLLEEERRRWGEIRGLLGATAPAAEPAAAPAPAAPAAASEAPGTSAPSPVEAAPSPPFQHPYSRALEVGLAALQNLPPRPEAAPPAPEAAAPQRLAFPTGFTVGSLKQRR